MQMWECGQIISGEEQRYHSITFFFTSVLLLKENILVGD